jgi:hypothetical protein
MYLLLISLLGAVSSFNHSSPIYNMTREEWASQYLQKSREPIPEDGPTHNFFSFSGDDTAIPDFFDLRNETNGHCITGPRDQG